MNRATIRGAAAVLLAGALGGCMGAGPDVDPIADRALARAGAKPATSRVPAPPLDGIFLVLDLGDRRVYVRNADGAEGRSRQVESFPVAIGRRGYDTPTGRFQVTEKIVDPDWVQFDWKDPSKVIRRVPPGPDNPLGVRWIGFTSAYGWGIGFHGTPQPELLGHAVSHGCVRMRNADVVKLYDLVSIGTPVIVEP